MAIEDVRLDTGAHLAQSLRIGLRVGGGVALKAIGLRKLCFYIHGERRLQGTLVAADGTTATIRLDDATLTERVIALDIIDRARTVFHWGGADKPGHKASGAKSRTASTRPATTGKTTAGAAKPPPGPSDELDQPIEEEATA